MKIGYARVSTEDQKLDLQRDALLKEGVEQEFLFEEKKSGKDTKRPALQEALKYLRKGDVLVVWKLDRLSRSLKDLIELSEKLHSRGVDLVSIQDKIDTTSAMGNFLFHLLGALAELERAMISERTKAGLAAAKKRGRMGGRKPKLKDKDIKAGLDLLKYQHWNVSQLCTFLKVGRNTWYRSENRYLLAQEEKLQKARAKARTA